MKFIRSFFKAARAMKIDGVNDSWISPYRRNMGFLLNSILSSVHFNLINFYLSSFCKSKFKTKANERNFQIPLTILLIQHSTPIDLRLKILEFGEKYTNTILRCINCLSSFRPS